MSDQAKALAEALAAPFPAGAVKWKAQAVSGERALAVPYVDARVVMDRLDRVLGVGGWQDAYNVLPGGQVVCRLSVCLAGEWLTKCDVGGPSEQPDEGDQMKAAFSDALKRAAVKFGVGRYLYRLPHQWVAYDARRRQLAESPELPEWALPRRPAPEKPQPSQLARLVAASDAKAAGEGLAEAGALTGFLQAALAPEFGPEVSAWPEEARPKVLQLIRQFAEVAREARPPSGEDLDRLGEALKAASRGWASLAKELGLPRGTQPSGLSAGQLRKALELLGAGEPAGVG